MTDEQLARLRRYTGAAYPSPEDVRAAVDHIDAQAARIADLEQQRDHARHWANWSAGIDTAFTRHPTPGVRAAAAFVWDSENACSKNVQASDGWEVGGSVS